MSKKFNLHDILKLYEAVDAVSLLDEKLKIIEEYLTSLKMVEKVRIYSLLQKPAEMTRETFFSPVDLSLHTKEEELENLIPEKPEIVEMGEYIDQVLQESGWMGQVLCYPLQNNQNLLMGVIFLKGQPPGQVLADYDFILRFLSSKLKEILENDLLKEKLEKENHFLKFISSQEKLELDNIFSWESSQLINWINLPLYIADFQGKLIYANKVFLKLLNLDSVEQLLQGYEVFPDRNQREREMHIIKSQGRVDNFKITVIRADGVRLAIRDSALIMGTYIFGFFFDVTELVRLNYDLKEALGMQEFLNDKLISSSLLLQKTQGTTIRSLALLAEYRDQKTGTHLDRICDYSALLVQQIYHTQPYSWRITEKYITDIAVSSMLHDIGKVGVPDSILLKPEALTAKEFEKMQYHTIWGHAILSKADEYIGEQSYLTLAAAIALHHHEKYDGSGYPHKLAGEAIPLSARIEAVADVYDALTSERPYKKKWSHEQAVEEIIRQKGKHFDPLLVEAFLQIEDKFYKISRRNKKV